MMTLLMSYCPGIHDSVKFGLISPTIATTSPIGVTTIRMIVSALPLITVCFKTMLMTSLVMQQVKRTVFAMTRSHQKTTLMMENPFHLCPPKLLTLERDDLGLTTAPRKGRFLADHLFDDKEVGLSSFDMEHEGDGCG
jgi:hypothetical protein